MKNKYFLYIAIVTFMTMTVWAFFDIMHSRAKVQTPPEIKSLLEPINTGFDQEVINGL